MVVGAARHIEHDAVLYNACTPYGAMTNQCRAVLLGLAKQGEHVRVRIDDAGHRRVQGADAMKRRFERTCLIGREQVQYNAVCAGCLPDAPKLCELCRGRRDDQLAAALMCHAVLLAVSIKQGSATKT